MSKSVYAVYLYYIIDLILDLQATPIPPDAQQQIERS